MDDGRATRPRSRRRLAIGGICVVLVIAAGSCLEAGAPAPDPLPSAESPPPGPRGEPVASSWLLDEPTRGSLASDRPFVEGVRELPWSSGPTELTPDGQELRGPPEPPPERRTVVFAGDVPGGRWAVVVGPVDYGSVPGLPSEVAAQPDVAAMVFTGPRGAAPEELRSTGGVNLVPADWRPALVDPTTGTLLVVPRPGDEVEVSERPEIAADGSGTRDYRKVEITDGVAVVRLPTTGQSNWSATFRLLRQGRPQSELFPWPVTMPDGAVPDLSIGFPRGEPSPTGRAVAARTAEQVLAEVGLPPEDLQVAAQWVGSVPEWGAGEVAVVTVTLPSGAVVVSAQVHGPDQGEGSSISGICGRAVLPAGPPASRRLYALTCDVFDVQDGETRGTSLVVVAPRDVTLVRTYSGNRVFLGEHTAVDGVVVVPLARNTDSVEAVLPGGISLGRVDVLGYAEVLGD